GPCCLPSLALPLRISLVLSVVPLMAIAVIWWGLLVLSWFPYCGISLSLVPCRVFLYLFCCWSAEVLGSWSTVKRSVGLVFYTRSQVYFMVFPSPSGAGPGWGFWLGSSLSLYIPSLYFLIIEI